MATYHTFEIIKGSTFRATLECGDGEGGIRDLTGAKVWVGLKLNSDDDDSAAPILIDSVANSSQFDMTHADISVPFTLTHENTSADGLLSGQTYKFAIKVKLADGTYAYPVLGEAIVQAGIIDAT